MKELVEFHKESTRAKQKSLKKTHRFSPITRKNIYLKNKKKDIFYSKSKGDKEERIRRFSDLDD